MPCGWLAKVGVDTASYATVKRRLPIYVHRSWRQSLAVARVVRRHHGDGQASRYPCPSPELVLKPAKTKA